MGTIVHIQLYTFSYRKPVFSACTTYEKQLRIEKTRLSHQVWSHGGSTFKKKKDIKRPFFPPCRNWPIWGSVFSRVEILWLGPGSPFGASLLAALRPYLTPHWCCWLPVPCCCQRTLSCWPKTAIIWIWHMFDVNINFQLVLGKLQKSLMLGSFCPDFPM